MTTDLYLQHHGIKGQSWGERHGPPYPLDYESHTSKQIRENPSSRLGKKKPLKLTDKRKKYIKIGAGVLAATAVGVGAYMLYKKYGASGKQLVDSMVTNNEFEKDIAGIKPDSNAITSKSSSSIINEWRKNVADIKTDLYSMEDCAASSFNMILSSCGIKSKNPPSDQYYPPLDMSVASWSFGKNSDGDHLIQSFDSDRAWTSNKVAEEEIIKAVQKSGHDVHDGQRGVCGIGGVLPNGGTFKHAINWIIQMNGNTPTVLFYSVNQTGRPALDGFGDFFNGHDPIRKPDPSFKPEILVCDDFISKFTGKSFSDLPISIRRYCWPR